MKIDNTKQDWKYCLGGDKDETINHIVSECIKRAEKEYKSWHEWVKKVIYRELYIKLKFDNTTIWSKCKPESTLENETHKIAGFWDKNRSLTPDQKPRSHHN